MFDQIKADMRKYAEWWFMIWYKRRTFMIIYGFCILLSNRDRVTVKVILHLSRSSLELDEGRLYTEYMISSEQKENPPNPSVPYHPQQTLLAQALSMLWFAPPAGCSSPLTSSLNRFPHIWVQLLQKHYGLQHPQTALKLWFTFFDWFTPWMDRHGDLLVFRQCRPRPHEGHR